MHEPVIIVGAGGHACSAIDCLLGIGVSIAGAVSLEPPTQRLPGDVAWLGNDDALTEHDPGAILLINGVGSTSNLEKRAEIYRYWTSRGYRFAGFSHPDATVSPHAVIADGAQIFARAIIGPGAEIGANTIVNSGAVIEHHTHIDNHCHVAPGAIVCGETIVGERTHIGAGATVIQGIQIGSNACIGSGAVVLRDIESNARAWGNPARLHEHAVAGDRLATG